jgi:hypothetical protein
MNYLASLMQRSRSEKDISDRVKRSYSDSEALATKERRNERQRCWLQQIALPVLPTALR